MVIFSLAQDADALGRPRICGARRAVALVLNIVSLDKYIMPEACYVEAFLTLDLLMFISLLTE